MKMSSYGIKLSTNGSSNSESDETENLSTSNTSLHNPELEAAQNSNNLELEINLFDNETCQKISEFLIHLPKEQQNTFYDRLVCGAKLDDLKDVEEIELNIHENGPSLQRIALFMPNLRKLNCSGSNIASLRSVGSELEFLKILNISNCGIESLDGLISLPNLEELYVQSNQVSDVGPCVFAKRLRIVNFKRNNISDIECVGFLSLCAELRYANFQECPITMYPHYRRILKYLIPQLISLDDIDFECRGSYPLPLEDDNCKNVDEKNQDNTTCNGRNMESTTKDSTIFNTPKILLLNNSKKATQNIEKENDKFKNKKKEVTQFTISNYSLNKSIKSNGLVDKGTNYSKLFNKVYKNKNDLRKDESSPNKSLNLVTASLEKIDSYSHNLKLQNPASNVIKLPPITLFGRRPVTSNCELHEVKFKRNANTQTRPLTSRNFDKKDYIEDLETIKKMLKNLPTSQNPFIMEYTNEVDSNNSNNCRKNENTEILLEASRRWRVRSASYRLTNL